MTEICVPIPTVCTNLEKDYVFALANEITEPAIDVYHLIKDFLRNGDMTICDKLSDILPHRYVDIRGRLFMRGGKS